MPRRPRFARTPKGGGGEAPASWETRRRLLRPPKPIRSVICPVCFRWVPGGGWAKVVSRDPPEPLGVVQEKQVGGGLPVVGRFGPDDDPDGIFPIVREALLRAVAWCVSRGLVSAEEVLQALKSTDGARPR